MTIYNTLQSALGLAGGNTIATDEIFCPYCDCSKGHKCLVCENEMPKGLCFKNDGICNKCVNENQGDKNERRIN